MKAAAALLLTLAAAAATAPATAQDIRGLEVCTAEKQMDRRTSCLQSNVEFLQQALTKHTQDSRAKLAAANRDLSAAHAEIAALKARLAKLENALSQLRARSDKAKSGGHNK